MGATSVDPKQVLGVGPRGRQNRLWFPTSLVSDMATILSRETGWTTVSYRPARDRHPERHKPFSINDGRNTRLRSTGTMTIHLVRKQPTQCGTISQAFGEKAGIFR
jgi:hypothetical protein